MNSRRPDPPDDKLEVKHRERSLGLWTRTELFQLRATIDRTLDATDEAKAYLALPADEREKIERIAGVVMRHICKDRWAWWGEYQLAVKVKRLAGLMACEFLPHAGLPAVAGALGVTEGTVESWQRWLRAEEAKQTIGRGRLGSARARHFALEMDELRRAVKAAS